MKSLEDWIRKKAQRSPRLYAFLRFVKRRVASVRDVRGALDGPPLPRDALHARIEIKGSPPSFNVGAPSRLAVEVTNLSPYAWPGGGRIALSYHWRRADGSVWTRDGGRTGLSGALSPGGTVTLDCTVTPPNTPAPYVLELELVSGGDAWFGPEGSTRREIVVGGMQPDAFAEIDYEKIYDAADLKKDFWGVVGPASAEEFRQLGKGKLEMLKALGLNPRSKILDVGCGTGSLAEPMVDFLGSEGLYYGTDLSEVAVQFCREKYVRPNFLFAKNGMTTLPIADERFDFIVFFSVFTHTYPAETGELLGEAARVLRDTGMIIADVFEAEIDGDSLGTRAMIVLDRRRTLDLAEARGLEARTISEFIWDPTGPRRIIRVMRRFSKRSGGGISASRTGTAGLP